MYLIVVIDLHNRYVLNWSVSNTIDASWCKEALEKAIAIHGKPEIINIDQGSQFTSEVFTKFALGNGIKLSMDGKGRTIDNVFIEHLWRTLKYESIYPNLPDPAIDLYRQLKKYFNYYNNKRRYQRIENRIPVNRYSIKNKQVA